MSQIFVPSSGVGPLPSFEYTNVVGPIIYDATDTDYYLSVDCSAGVVTIQLPDFPAENREFIIKDRTGNAANLNILVKSLTGSSTLDLSDDYVLTDDFESIQLLWHNDNYEIF